MDVRRFILIAVFGASCGILSGCNTSLVSQNQTHISNQPSARTTENKAPELDVKQPLVPGTLTKVSGWVPSGKSAEVQLDGQTSGSFNAMQTQSDGYFTGSILVPDDIPKGTATIRLMVGSQTLLTETINVADPYTTSVADPSIDVVSKNNLDQWSLTPRFVTSKSGLLMVDMTIKYKGNSLPAKMVKISFGSASSELQELRNNEYIVLGTSYGTDSKLTFSVTWNEGNQNMQGTEVLSIH